MKNEYEPVADLKEEMRVKLAPFEGMDEMEKLFAGKSAVVKSFLPSGTYVLVEIWKSNPSRKINWPKAALVQQKKEK